MANTIRIKRRAAGGAAGAPSSLANAELAFNEQDNTLYYGKGDSGGVATSVIAIGGNGSFVDLGSNQSITGTKTFSNIDVDGGTITGITDLAIADGGTGSSTAAGARTNLGATTVGSNFFTLANPSAITFPRINADNTVSALTASDFRTAIGAGTGNGSVTSVSVVSANGFAGTVANSTTTPAITLTTSITGLLKGNGTAISAASAGTDYLAPFGSQTANYVYAAPNGTAGTPTFRALVANDIPTLTAAKISDFDTQVRTSRLDQMAAPTGSVSMNSQKITGLATPTADTDAANKGYVDSVAQGLDPKASVRAATTANITLSGTQTIDGVSVIAGDRVLVKNQTTTSANGIYVAAASTWARAADMDNWTEVPNAFVFVEEGTTNADTGWVCTSNAGGTLGTTAVAWAQFSGAGTYIAGNGLTLTGNTFAVGGTANRITTTSTTVDIASTYVGQTSITTLGTIATGTWSATAIAANKGGTGQTSYTTGDLLYASGAAALSKLADVATGNALLSGGVGAAPAYGKVGLTTHISGTLAVGNGGTGATTFTSKGIIYGNGTSALQVTAAGTWDGTNSVGQILSVDSAGTPTWTNTIDGGTF